MSLVMQLIGLLVGGFVAGVGFWYASKFVGRRGRMA